MGLFYLLLCLTISSIQADRVRRTNFFTAGDIQNDGDYPSLSSIPATNFQCKDQQESGLYADIETRCQVYHNCHDGQQTSFLCATGTIFNQETQSCDNWFNVDCASSAQFFYLNRPIVLNADLEHKTDTAVQSQGVKGKTNHANRKSPFILQQNAPTIQFLSAAGLSPVEPQIIQEQVQLIPQVLEEPALLSIKGGSQQLSLKSASVKGAPQTPFLLVQEPIVYAAPSVKGGSQAAVSYAANTKTSNPLVKVRPSGEPCDCKPAAIFNAASQTPVSRPQSIKTASKTNQGSFVVPQVTRKLPPPPAPTTRPFSPQPPRPATSKPATVKPQPIRPATVKPQPPRPVTARPRPAPEIRAQVAIPQPLPFYQPPQLAYEGKSGYIDYNQYAPGPYIQQGYGYHHNPYVGYYPESQQAFQGYYNPYSNTFPYGYNQNQYYIPQGKGQQAQVEYPLVTPNPRPAAVPKPVTTARPVAPVTRKITTPRPLPATTLRPLVRPTSRPVQPIQQFKEEEPIFQVKEADTFFEQREITTQRPRPTTQRPTTQRPTTQRPTTQRHTTSRPTTQAIIFQQKQEEPSFNSDQFDQVLITERPRPTTARPIPVTRRPIQTTTAPAVFEQIQVNEPDIFSQPFAPQRQIVEDSPPKSVFLYGGSGAEQPILIQEQVQVPFRFESTRINPPKPFVFQNQATPSLRRNAPVLQQVKDDSAFFEQQKQVEVPFDSQDKPSIKGIKG